MTLPIYLRNMNPRSIAAALITGGAALVASTTAFSADAYPKAIRQAVDSGVKVVRQFPAVSGLTGWVLAQDGHYSTVYTTADKKTLLAGALIGERGESISAQYEEKYVPKPDLGVLFQQLEKSSYVAEGSVPARKRPSTYSWTPTVHIVTPPGSHFSLMKRPVSRCAGFPWPPLGRPACQRQSR